MFTIALAYIQGKFDITFEFLYLGTVAIDITLIEGIVEIVKEAMK